MLITLTEDKLKILNRAVMHDGSNLTKAYEAISGLNIPDPEKAQMKQYFSAQIITLHELSQIITGIIQDKSAQIKVINSKINDAADE
jgi:hypothetical protein